MAFRLQPKLLKPRQRPVEDAQAVKQTSIAAGVAAVAADAQVVEGCQRIGGCGAAANQHGKGQVRVLLATVVVKLA